MTGLCVYGGAVLRIDYLSSYIDEVFRARRDGADIRGYMAWSLLDNFEYVSHVFW